MADTPPNPIGPVSRTSDRVPPTRSAADPDPGSSGAVEEALLQRVSARDQKAMAELFDLYSGMVYSVALRVLKDTAQAEDVMQEIFFQVWQQPQTFVRGRGSLGAWLAVIARNRAIDSLRRRKPSDPVEDVVLASSTNLASEVERNTMMEKVRVVLDALPIEQRDSIELAYFEGLSHSEIAARTGDPLGTVKTRIRSALMNVRKAFRP